MTPMQRKFLIGTIISAVVGTIGGLICLPFGAPFILGFAAGFVLTGMISLFAIAAALESARDKKP